MLKFGIIGLGSMSKNHARVCSELQHIDLVKVTKINKTNMKIIGKRFGTKAFADYKKIFHLCIYP